MIDIVSVGDKDINFELYLRLLEEKAAEDPLFVFAKFAELQLLIHQQYREYSERQRRSSRTLKTMESRLRTKFSSKDDASNPLLAEGIKLTKDNVTAFIESIPEYIALQQEIDDLQEHKNHIGSIRTLVDKCLDMIKIEARKNEGQDNLNEDLSQLLSNDTY